MWRAPPGAVDQLKQSPMGRAVLINTTQLCPAPTRPADALQCPLFKDTDLGLQLKNFSVSGKRHWDPESHNVELFYLTIAKMRQLLKSHPVLIGKASTSIDPLTSDDDDDDDEDLCARKGFICINSFNPHNNSAMWVLSSDEHSVDHRG